MLLRDEEKSKEEKKGSRNIFGSKRKELKRDSPTETMTDDKIGSLSYGVTDEKKFIKDIDSNDARPKEKSNKNKTSFKLEGGFIKF